jgi:hypothetical protein
VFFRVSRVSLVLLLLLSACGDLPRPPPARLAVPVPDSTQLPGPANKSYAQAVAAALHGQEIPAVAEAAKSGDWRLALTAEQRADTVVPIFTIIDNKGEPKGTEQGDAIPTAIWQQAAPGTMMLTAAEVAPRLAALLARIEALRRQSDPTSLYNRPARVMVATVTGAPGDGNQALSRLLRDKLAALGPLVQESPIGADFTVQCKVDDVPAGPQTRHIEIVWMVFNARNEDVGQIMQLKEVPTGTLDRDWGDLAVVVTNEAAAAIRDVILTQSGRR